MKVTLHHSGWFQQSETDVTSEDKRHKQTKKLQSGFIHEKQTQEKGIKGEKKLHFYGIVGNKTHFYILNYKKTDNTNIFCSRFSM